MSETDRRYTEATVRSTALHEYLTAVGAITNEAAIHLSPAGAHTAAVDPANVAMVRAELDDTAFLDAPGGEATFGANIPRLADVLREDSGATDLTYDDERRVVDLSNTPFSYTHATTDPDNIRDEPTIPELDLTFRAEIDGDWFREAIEWFDTFSSHVRIGYDTTERRFWMEATEGTGSSTGTDDGGVSLDGTELEIVHEVGDADSQFSLDYFTDIVDGIPEGRTVELYVGEEFPMKLSFDVGHGEVQYVQAPRIAGE